MTLIFSRLNFKRVVSCESCESVATSIKAGSHCNADLRHCSVTDILRQCEHCSSVIAVAGLTFGVSSEKLVSTFSITAMLL